MPKAESSFQLLFFLMSAILARTSSVQALSCYQCLQLPCASSSLCHSIKLSMSNIFFARRNHLEFNPNVTCPSAPFGNTTTWSPYSHECRKSDSVCLQAKVEVLTSFSGLRDSLALDPMSDTSSKGYLRACASRRFLLSLSEPTLEVKDQEANLTLAGLRDDQTSADKFSTDKLTLTEIFFHHFYMDHGTDEAVKCIRDNCNAKDPPPENGGSEKPHQAPPKLVLIVLSLCFFNL